MRRYLALGLLALLAVIGVACGGQSEPTPPPPILEPSPALIPTSTQAPTPTAASVSMPTPTPSAVATSTATSVPTPTPTPSAVATPNATSAPMPTPTPTVVPTPTATSVPTPTPTVYTYRYVGAYYVRLRRCLRPLRLPQYLHLPLSRCLRPLLRLPHYRHLAQRQYVSQIEDSRPPPSSILNTGSPSLRWSMTVGANSPSGFSTAKGIWWSCLLTRSDHLMAPKQ